MEIRGGGGGGGGGSRVDIFLLFSLSSFLPSFLPSFFFSFQTHISFFPSSEFYHITRITITITLTITLTIIIITIIIIIIINNKNNNVRLIKISTKILMIKENMINDIYI